MTKEFFMRNFVVTCFWAGLCITQSLAYPALAQGRSDAAATDRQIDREVDRRIDRQVARQVDRSAERQIETQIGRGMERQLDSQLGTQIQKQVSRHVGTEMERRIPPGAQSHGDREMADNASRRKAGNAHAQDTQPTTRNDRQRKETEQLDIYFDVATDNRGFRYLRNQRLLLIGTSTFTDLKKRGLLYRKATTLQTLGRVLVELNDADANAYIEQFGTVDPSASLDEVNHLYRYQLAETDINGGGWAPQEALPIRTNGTQHREAKIGLIDSRVDRDHESFRQTQITAVSFVEKGLTEPATHGTAVLSILGGKTEQYQGLLPQAQFYSASVFFSSAQHGNNASVKSILLALDWMVQNDVEVINLSLTGPPNPLFELAIREIAERGIIVVAAAGNGGPGAPPAYPAAYPGVVAVTALTHEDHPYYRANHGSYIDFAAPGVGISTASDTTGFVLSSGTSFAAPFVTAVLAAMERDKLPYDIVQTLRDHAIDLGKPGVDDVFGYGKIRLPESANHLQVNADP